MEPATADTEAELERFRERWRAEVSKVQVVDNNTRDSAHAYKSQSRKEATLPSDGLSSSRRKDLSDYSEDFEPRAYHDLPNKDDSLQLGTAGQNHDREANREPSTALEHYEKGVEKETQGNLGDSMRHYRKAFKLDDGVHEKYKNKHFPASSFKLKPTNPNPSNAAVTVPNPAHQSLHGSNDTLPSSLRQLVEQFSALRIEAPPPATNISPQEHCPLAGLPEEILSQILASLAVTDFAAFARMAQICKRLAYLVLTEEAIWKRVAVGDEFGFGAMHYDYACDIEGFPVEANDEIARYLASYDESDEVAELPSTPEKRAIALSARTERLLHATYTSSWRQMFRLRPRIRFNGCYISTVNYTRAGGTFTNTLTWGAPVHMVTYFRYLRFFRDGTVISLLSTSEPADVVHHLTKENMHEHHGNYLPSSVMKDALRGRWRLTGPLAIDGEAEVEGDVHVETEGVVPKYTYKMVLALAHAGKSTRNNKLAWKGFWSYNRLTDDWSAFGLKNDKAFYWSRVKSYGFGY